MEIYWSGTWGAISDSSWTAAEADVICKHLRHSDYGNSPHSVHCVELFIHSLKVWRYPAVICLEKEVDQYTSIM